MSFPADHHSTDDADDFFGDNHRSGDSGHPDRARYDDGFFDDEYDEDLVSIRPERSRVKKALIALGVLTFIGLILFLVGRSWVSAQLDPPGEPTEEVQVVIETGSTTGDIAGILETEEVVPSSFFFRYYAQWNNEGDFLAGEYTFKKNMSADEAIAVLKAGPRPIEEVTIQIQEGLWLNEILPLLAADLPNVSEEDLQAVLDSGELSPRYRPDDQDSWEGFLFPDTYKVNKEASAFEVLSMLTSRFADVASDSGYGRNDRPNNLSAYEVLIVASLIEAEAKTDADRPKIARVIYNRLDKNEWLGIDATLIYASEVRGQVPTAEQLKTPGPYNTRAEAGNRGLPPTPIGVPGEASLKAAMNPEPGDWFWYVLADAEGNHFFTESQEEFDRQKAKSREEGLL